LYWDIGKSIVTKQDTLGWGKAIVEILAKRGGREVVEKQHLLNSPIHIETPQPNTS
jgi:hypothetical protein